MRRLIVTSLVLSALTSAGAARSSRIEFSYDERTDEQCSSVQSQPIKSDWAAELRSRLPEFQALWESVGPTMTDAVATITKKPFAPAGPVHLTLCDTPSNSLVDVTVNMRHALRSFTSTPVPLRYKVDTTFHETLHAFVSHNTPARSMLLSANSSESSCVRNHLHLLALQKAVLLFIGDTRSLEQVIAIDSQLPSGCYKRAWELVNTTPDTYKRYVAELSE